ncbi:hypothetical protein T484DRAFT_1758674 [Baffinella frigidus]|nr:hypothetical protein T484DRAFT_1758674 [Cryptophyta sp. CCMP2293]
MKLLIPVSKEVFQEISTNIMYVISTVTRVNFADMKIDTVESYETPTQRRLLTSSVRVGITIEIRATNGESTQQIATKAQTVAASLTSASIQDIISKTPTLRDIIPNGVLVSDIRVINAAPASEEIDLIYIIIGGSGVLLVVLLCACVTLLVVWCRPRKKMNHHTTNIKEKRFNYAYISPPNQGTYKPNQLKYIHQPIFPL